MQLLQDSAICRLTSSCDLPCRLSFSHSAFYPPFRRPFRIFGFRILFSAFRNSAFYQSTAFGDCHDSNPLVRHLLLTIYMLFWLYFFTNNMNDATTNEIKLSKADF